MDDGANSPPKVWVPRCDGPRRVQAPGADARAENVNPRLVGLLSSRSRSSRKLLRVVHLGFFIFIEILLVGVQIHRHGLVFGHHITRRHQELKSLNDTGKEPMGGKYHHLSLQLVLDLGKHKAPLGSAETGTDAQECGSQRLLEKQGSLLLVKEELAGDEVVANVHERLQRAELGGETGR